MEGWIRGCLVCTEKGLDKFVRLFRRRWSMSYNLKKRTILWNDAQQEAHMAAGKPLTVVVVAGMGFLCCL